MEPILIFIIAYIGFHLALYLVYLRKRRLFRSETGIFFYHVGSFVCLAVALLICAWTCAGVTTAITIAGICLHGIYSLSFLELWALTKTGFSLRILSQVDRMGPQTAQEILAPHIKSGDEKKRQRLRSLESIRFVRDVGGCYVLTKRGRYIATFLGFLAGTAGARDVG